MPSTVVPDDTLTKTMAWLLQALLITCTLLQHYARGLSLWRGLPARDSLSAGFSKASLTNSASGLRVKRIRLRRPPCAPTKVACRSRETESRYTCSRSCTSEKTKRSSQTCCEAPSSVMSEKSNARANGAVARRCGGTMHVSLLCSARQRIHEKHS